MVTLLLAVAGCSGATEGSTNESSTGTVPDASPPPTSLTVHGLVRGPNGTVVPGASVCLERGTSDSTVTPVSCSTSGTDGSFTLSDPQAAASATLTFRATGFLPMLYPFYTAGDMTIASIDSTLVEDRGTLLGVAIDPSKAEVPFDVTAMGAVFPEPTPVVTATSTLLDYFTGFNGPAVPAVYGDENGSAVPGATAGTAGAFVNLNPGMYALRFEFSNALAASGQASLTGAACAAGLGMPGSSAGLTSGSSVLYAVVRAGYVMAPIVVSCIVP